MKENLPFSQARGRRANFIHFAFSSWRWGAVLEQYPHFISKNYRREFKCTLSPHCPHLPRTGRSCPDTWNCDQARHRPAASVPKRERRTSECGRRATSLHDNRASHGLPPDLLQAPKEGLAPPNPPKQFIFMKAPVMESEFI